MTKVKEIWKDVVQYPSLYQVSSFGRIRSKPRIRIGGYGCEYTAKSKLLKIKKEKYSIVFLKPKLQRHKKFYLHRLVAEAFLERKSHHTEVNHKDLDKHNNMVSNLEWCTREENRNHAIRLGCYQWRKVIFSSKETQAQTMRIL